MISILRTPNPNTNRTFNPNPKQTLNKLEDSLDKLSILSKICNFMI